MKELSFDYRKHLKKYPEVILEKLPKDYLTRKQQRTLYLRNQGLTYEEIAELLGITKQGVERRMDKIVRIYMDYRGMADNEKA